MIPPLWLAGAYGLSELAVAMLLRSKGESSTTDRGSLRTLMIVINGSVFGAILAAALLRGMYFGNTGWYWVGVFIFVAGLALRWYSIVTLGRFFTVDVTVAADQRVIDTGPYRFVRHPSYTGVLLAFLGLALCFGNVATLFMLLVPTTAVFLYRIRIEESAMQVGLGAAYIEYMQRTKRLVPFLY